MKKVLILSLICSHLLGNAQNYPVFPDSMATWTNAFINYQWGGGQTFVSANMTKYNMTNQDTVINSLSYSKIYFEDSLYVGGTRVDSNQVYFALHGDSVEYLLFDFGAQIGDTIFDVFRTYDGNDLIEDSYFDLENYVVFDTDSVLCYDGILRKRLFLSSTFNDYHLWVEGVGDLGGLFWWDMLNVSNYFVDLARLCVNDEMVFLNNETYVYIEDNTQVCTSDLVTNIQKIEEIPLSVFPIPASEWLYIEANALNKPFQYRIINSIGQPVIDGMFGIEENTKINVQSLNTGIYFLNIGFSDQWYSQKIIVE